MIADLCRQNSELGRCDLLLNAFVVNDSECKKVAVASDGEYKLLIIATCELSDCAIVIVMHRQAPVRSHQAWVVIVYRLDPDTAILHSKDQVLVAANGNSLF